MYVYLQETCNDSSKKDELYDVNCYVITLIQDEQEIDDIYISVFLLAILFIPWLRQLSHTDLHPECDELQQCRAPGEGLPPS